MTPLTQTADVAIPELARLQRRLLIAGAVGAAVSLVGCVHRHPTQFFQSYLMAYMLCLGVTLGCLALGMVHQLSGGAWGVVIRRPIGAASRVLPVMTAAVPADRARHAPPLRLDATPISSRTTRCCSTSTLYLNTPFFLVRAAIYFAVWNALVVLPEPLVARAGPDRRSAHSRAGCSC